MFIEIKCNNETFDPVGVAPSRTNSLLMLHHDEYYYFIQNKMIRCMNVIGSYL